MQQTERVAVDQQRLVERAREGDHDAFAELARATVVRLDEAARLILRDPELARDAVQEALLRAWRDLRKLRDPARFEAWLHRLTVNACLDRARKAASRKTSPVDDTERLEQLLEPHEEASAPAERNDLHRQRDLRTEERVVRLR